MARPRSQVCHSWLLRCHHSIHYILCPVSLPLQVQQVFCTIVDNEQLPDLEIWIEVSNPANLCTICTSLKSTDLGLSFLPPQYESIFIHCNTASLRKSHIGEDSVLWSFSVIKIASNRKHTCNFQLAFYCNYMPIAYLISFPRRNELLGESHHLSRFLPTPV